MVKIYKQPFAHDGDTVAIPDASQPDGKMSKSDGWTVDYQLPSDDPNYKPVDRQEMNGVFKEVTEAIGEMQVQGAASWSSDGVPYPINAQVYHSGKQWIALRANSVQPVEGEDWKAADLSSSIRLSEPIDQVPDAETVQQALSGIGEYVDQTSIGIGQSWQDVTSSRTDDTIYTNTTGRAITVNITFSSNESTNVFVSLLDGSNNTLSAFDSVATGSKRYTISAIIPPSTTYKIEKGNRLEIINWMELR